MMIDAEINKKLWEEYMNKERVKHDDAYWLRYFAAVAIQGGRCHPDWTDKSDPYGATISLAQGLLDAIRKHEAKK